MRTSRVPNATEMQTAEEMILQAGTVLNEAVYEKFSCGEITQSEMHKLYRVLTQWTILSEQLLNSVN